VVVCAPGACEVIIPKLVVGRPLRRALCPLRGAANPFPRQEGTAGSSFKYFLLVVLVFPFVQVETYLTRNFTTVPATRVKKEVVPARVKKEPPVKTDVKDEPAPGEDELPWCVKELKMADAVRYPDDPADESGLHLLQARSFNEA
jgi:hypothetical protein